MDDTPFSALADEDRRRLLLLLASRTDRDPPVRVPDDLVGTEPTARATSVRFHHVHLPKLASMGYVEWDPDSGAVRCGPAFDELEPLLDVLDEHERPGSD